METITLFVDHREPGKIAQFFRNLGYAVTVTELENGDVLSVAIDKKIHVFEFKRVYTGDATGSIFSGHLLDQMLRLMGFEPDEDGEWVKVKETSAMIHLILIGSVGHLQSNIQKSIETVGAEYSSFGIDVHVSPTDDMACYYVHQTLQFANNRHPIQAPVVDNLPASESGLVRALMQITYRATSEMIDPDGKKQRREPGIGMVKAKLLANNRSWSEISAMTEEQLSDAMRAKKPKGKAKLLKIASTLRRALDERKQTITGDEIETNGENEE